MKKKDYISEPKENGYQSLHYSFLTPYGNNEIYVELQLRTIDMDLEISNAKEISHFTYSIKKNKWAELFSEVHF
jgi:(p)ppGpp synthase/HD superfamily hydrolase